MGSMEYSRVFVVLKVSFVRIVVGVMNVVFSKFGKEVDFVFGGVVCGFCRSRMGRILVRKISVLR